MTANDAANSTTTANRPRGGGWKPGQSGNPTGRPKDGQSWAGVLRKVTDKSAEDLAAMIGGNQTELGRQMLLLPAGVPLKYLVAIRIVAALMFEPNGSLWRAIAQTEQLTEFEERIIALEQRAKP